MVIRIGSVLAALLLATTTSTPPGSYRFVDPPPAFAPGNVEPTDFATSIALGPKGSVAAKVETTDSQFVITMAPGAIASAKGATSISLRITALAPRHLAAVPDGLRANGNAYQVDMNYQPTGVSIAQLATAGTLVIRTPQSGENLFLSPDAKSWTPLAAQPVSPSTTGTTTTLKASFVAPGFYLAATDQAAPAVAGKSSNHAVTLIIVVAIAALVALFIASILRRRGRAATA